MALDEAWSPTTPLQQLHQLLPRDAGQQRGIGDLVAVEMKNRQNGAIARGVQKLVGMPRRGQRPGLRFAVADDASDHERRIVKHGAEGVARRITELAALMNRSRALRGRVTRNAAGE